MSDFAPDTTYRGLRINQDGNRNWQVCYDYPGGRFRILAVNLASVEAAKTLIEALRPDHVELLAEVGRLTKRADALEKQLAEWKAVRVVGMTVPEIAALQKRADALAAALDPFVKAAMAEHAAASAYFEMWSASHERKDCPEDDTCRCLAGKLGNAGAKLFHRACDARAALGVGER